jgi:hypothetical protein
MSIMKAEIVVGSRTGCALVQITGKKKRHGRGCCVYSGSRRKTGKGPALRFGLLGLLWDFISKQKTQHAERSGRNGMHGMKHAYFADVEKLLRWLGCMSREIS